MSEGAAAAAGYGCGGREPDAAGNVRRLGAIFARKSFLAGKIAGGGAAGS